MATRKPAARVAGKKEARPAAAPDPEKSEALAKMALRPSVNAAAVMVSYSKPLGIEQDDIGALMDRLADDVKDVWAGDMKRAEAMLFGQAHALQAIFMNLARRATTQEYLKQWEAYLRMALKAQNQCRMTLEALATIKNPPVVFARQANINNGGQQQVNNGPAPANETSTRAGTQARAANSSTEQTKLLEVNDGERMDAGAASAAGGTDPQLEAVGAVNRTAN
jgi:hypothetical protein